MTTYFDAQIIGTQLGFVTQDDWRANRLGDLAHWSLFSAFHEVKKDLVEPNLLLPDNTSSPALFMRWKERYRKHVITERNIRKWIVLDANAKRN